MRIFCFLRQSFLDIARHFTCQTRRQRNNSLVKFLQNLHIDTRLVIVPLRKTAADDFAQIRVTSIIFRQKHQMVIPVIPAGNLPVKTGIGRNIDLTAQNRIDTLCPRRTVKSITPYIAPWSVIAAAVMPSSLTRFTYSLILLEPSSRLYSVWTCKCANAIFL